MRRGADGRMPQDGFLAERPAGPTPAGRYLQELREREQARLRRKREDEEATRAYLYGQSERDE